jgi:microcystin-dependent protein
MTSVLRRNGNLNAMQRHTVGDTKTSLVAADHVGWLLCDGRDLNVSDYRQLFNVIGYSFGGSGTTFKLPAPQGRVPGFVGQADTTYYPTNTWNMGDVSGEEVHRLSLREMPKHNHTFSDPSGLNVALQSANLGFTDTSGGHNHGGVTNTTGLHNHNGSTGAGGFAAQTFEATRLLTDRATFADDTGTHTHSIAPDGDHSHTISRDGEHRHRIQRSGNSEVHNNIQPTIWLGNLFVYGGKLFIDSNGVSAPKGAMTFPYFGNNIY